MAKAVGVDYGTKRIGIAISDENRILAFALETISSSEIFSYLNQITIKENIVRCAWVMTDLSFWTIKI